MSQDTAPAYRTYSTLAEAIEREVLAALEPSADLTGPVDQAFDIDAIAEETIVQRVTPSGQAVYMQDPALALDGDGDGDRFWEIVAAHARPAGAEGQGPVALVAKYASRQDRGLGLDENGYTARLLSTVPRRTTPLGYARPGYVDLLALAAASAEHARWLGYSDPDGGIWGALAEEAEEAYQCLAGRTDPERLSDLASEIGTWLTDGGEPATLAIGGLALAWAAALLED